MPGVVVLASHDRAFLDEVCTDLIDLDPAMRYAARRLEEFEQSQVRKPPAPLRFHAPTLVAPSAAGMAVSLRGVDVSGRLHVERLDVGATDHLLLTGPNGVGKSTLLAVVAGVVPADGQVLRRPGLRIGYLPQDSVFDRLDQTAQQAYEACAGAERAERVSLRSLGLIAPRDAATPVSALSVGQRRRLALAIVLAAPPDLLLLDEPTNHLSPLLADELQDAFGTAPGAIVVASHDRWLRRRWDGPQVELTFAAPGSAQYETRAR